MKLWRIKRFFRNLIENVLGSIGIAIICLIALVFICFVLFWVGIWVAIILGAVLAFVVIVVGLGLLTGKIKVTINGKELGKK